MKDWEEDLAVEEAIVQVQTEESTKKMSSFSRIVTSMIMFLVMRMLGSLNFMLPGVVIARLWLQNGHNWPLISRVKSKLLR